MGCEWRVKPKLTCYLQCGIPAPCNTPVIFRLTPVNASIAIPTWMYYLHLTTSHRWNGTEQQQEQQKKMRENRKSIALNILTLKIHVHSLAIMMTTKQNYTLELRSFFTLFFSFRSASCSFFTSHRRYCHYDVVPCLRQHIAFAKTANSSNRTGVYEKGC